MFRGRFSPIVSDLLIGAWLEQHSRADSHLTPLNRKPPSSKPKSRIQRHPGDRSREFRDEQELQSPRFSNKPREPAPSRALRNFPASTFRPPIHTDPMSGRCEISVRGFNQNQLGFTLDDIPLGDMSYGNWNGLHISRAITDENIGRIVLSQGNRRA